MRFPYDKYTITCEYKRIGDWQIGYHTGVDLVGKEKEVKSICDGTVKLIAYSLDAYGNYIQITTEDNHIVMYCHLSKVNVKKGDKITEGQVIGVEGSTGKATGSHLHLEVRVSPFYYGNDIDPIAYIGGVKMFGYKKESGVHFIKIPVENFKIVEWNKVKKTTAIKNYCNAGFFASGKNTTEPMGNLIIDGVVKSETINSYGNLAGKKLHTIAITKDNAIVLLECNQMLRDTYKYAISGLPVTLDGQDVSWSKVCKPQGWTGGELRPTKHICMGYDSENIYIFGITTTNKTPGGAITQIWKKLKGYGLSNILLLDGGGSYVIDINGKNVDVTSENRRVNNLITYC